MDAPRIGWYLHYGHYGKLKSAIVQIRVSPSDSCQSFALNVPCDSEKRRPGGLPLLAFPEGGTLPNDRRHAIKDE